jgi:Tol biopolymer transport system component
LEDTNIYRTLATGEGVPTEFIASTRRDERSSYAPDGRIAFASDRSGSWEIWIAGPDGSSQVRVTNFGGPLAGFPRWSPDGRHLAFESKALGRSRIFVLECQSGGARCGKPMPLTSLTFAVPANFPEGCQPKPFVANTALRKTAG